MLAIVPTNQTIINVASKVPQRDWSLRGKVEELSGDPDPDRASREFVLTVSELREGAVDLKLDTLSPNSKPHFHFMMAVARAYERGLRKGDENLALELMLFKHYPVEESTEAYDVRDCLVRISETFGDSGTDFINFMIETLDDLYDTKAIAFEDGSSPTDEALLYLTQSDFESSISSGDNGFFIREESREYNLIIAIMNRIARLEFKAVEID